MSLGRSLTPWVMAPMPLELFWGGVWMVCWEDWLLASVMMIPAVSVSHLQISCLEDWVKRYFNMDFSDHQIFPDGKALSVEDQLFLPLMEINNLHQGHYQICLPLQGSSVPFSNYCPLALQRMKSLQKNFKASDTFRGKCVSFVDDLFLEADVSEVSVDEIHRDAMMSFRVTYHIMVLCIPRRTNGELF